MKIQKALQNNSLTLNIYISKSRAKAQLLYIGAQTEVVFLSCFQLVLIS